MIMPSVQMVINTVNNLVFTAFFNMMREGKLNVVIAIIKMLRWYLIVRLLQVMPLLRELFQKYQRT